MVIVFKDLTSILKSGARIVSFVAEFIKGVDYEDHLAAIIMCSKSNSFTSSQYFWGI